MVVLSVVCSHLNDVLDYGRFLRVPGLLVLSLMPFLFWPTYDRIKFVSRTAALLATFTHDRRERHSSSDFDSDLETIGNISATALALDWLEVMADGKKEVWEMAAEKGWFSLRSWDNGSNEIGADDVVGGARAVLGGKVPSKEVKKAESEGIDDWGVTPPVIASSW